MNTTQYYKKLQLQIEKRDDLKLIVKTLKYKKGKFLFWKIKSAKISRQDKVMILCAGVHGEETAGPLTFYHHLNKIVDFLHNHGLKVIIYPLRNPSGFETGLRYNIDNDAGDCGNNDLLRYQLAGGKIVDDLKDKNIFKQWFWSSAKKLKINLPAETRLFHKLLKQDLKYHIVACLDLHQDAFTLPKKPAAYQYAFGNTKIYWPIIEKIEKIVPILKNKPIGAGLGSIMKSDNLGFIERFDGTFGDFMFRNGVLYNITVETTTATPIKKAIQVNLIWIRELANLI